jgi:predicted P-loop ATPase
MNDKIKEFSDKPEKKLRPEKEVKKSSKNKLVKAFNYLVENYKFRYNVVTLEVEYKPIAAPDSEYKFFDDMAYRDLDQEVTLEATNISERYFKNWVYGTKLSKKYDPFREYVFKLRPWDGKTDHFRQFLEQVYLSDETQREFFVECFTKWFTAYVAGLVVDEIANQTCFVLVGAQGKFKTTLLNSLVPKDMRLDYLYSSTFIAHNKDHEKYLATKMIINLDEMQAFNRSDIESIKSKATQDRIALRLPYAKADIKAWRRASFVGSVNRDEFLNDATGSRRFLPFKIDAINMDRDFEIDRLYAQGFALYKMGKKYWFDSEDIHKLEAHNDPHKDKTIEEEFVLAHYEVPTEEDINNGRVEFLTASDVMAALCKKNEKMNSNNTVKRNLGVALQANGFEKVAKRRNGRPVKVWCVKEPANNDLTELDGSAILSNTSKLF